MIFAAHTAAAVVETVDDDSDHDVAVDVDETDAAEDNADSNYGR